MKKQCNDKNTHMFLSKREFIEERDWNKFHHPKELAISISLESVELLELFQCKDKETLKEIADILIYTLSFSNQLDIDLDSVIIKKLNKNNREYNKTLVKGKTKKCTYYSKGGEQNE